MTRRFFDNMAPPLSQLDVLVIDCQATAAFPRGHVLELGWAMTGTHAGAVSRLIKLPDGTRIPPAVTRITGISHATMASAVDGCAAWRDLSRAAAELDQQPAPTVVHFARFEQPFLASLAGGALPLDVVCTHEIARRLLPDLPRCSLRAIAGYFGGAVGALRRSDEHVEATAFIWRELVRMLDERGISTWEALHEWLSVRPPAQPRRRVWPIARELRLSLPDAPGVYRLLRTGGDVLYVGKASSLYERVNSYFRKQHGVPERMLEMLSQVRSVSFEVTPTALEAALLEPDEIKRHAPPYNIALTEERELWFTPPDLSERSRHASPRCPVGPFPSARLLDEFSALGRAGDLDHSGLLRLGTRLWLEGRRDCDLLSDAAMKNERQPRIWAAEDVQLSIERLAICAALARRRAKWLTRMVDASIVWTEPGTTGTRLIVIENGEVVVRGSVEAGMAPPIPPGHARPMAARREVFTVARFDRLRVLTTELKRLVAEGSRVALRFGVGPPIADGRLAYALSWV